MPVLPLLALLPALTGAELPAAPPPPALALADALAAEGEVDAARQVLEEATAFPEVAEEARARLATLPPDRRRTEAVARLATWQGLLGAYLLGPHLANVSWDPGRNATPYFLGAGLGAAAGAGSALWLGRDGLSPGQASATMTAQVLGGWNGAVIGHLVEPDGGPGWGTGLLAGTLAGAGAGTWLLLQDPHPGAVAAAASGSVWGFGLAGTAILLMEDEPRTDAGLWIPFLAGTDLGAAAGYGLARLLDIPPERVWLVDLGGAAGLAAGGFLVAIMDALDMELVYEQEPVVLMLAGTTLAGGAVAAVLTRGQTRAGGGRGAPVGSALFSGTPEDLRVALPLPHPTPPASPGGDAGLGLTLADLRF